MFKTCFSCTSSVRQLFHPSPTEEQVLDHIKVRFFFRFSDGVSDAIILELFETAGFLVNFASTSCNPTQGEVNSEKGTDMNQNQFLVLMIL